VIQGDLPLLKLAGDQDYLRQVVVSAADQSILDDTSEDSIKDSIRLYILAGSYEQAVDTVNRAMGHSLTQSAPQSTQDTANFGFDDVFEECRDIFDIAARLKWLYDKDYTKRSKVENRSWDTMSTLITLKQALRSFDNGDPAEALKVIRSTNLLPLDNDASAIPARAENFKSLLDQPTIQNLDVVILTTMRSLHMLSQQLKSSIYEDANRTEAMREYKVQAQAVIRFAGLLRLRLGADVYRQLSSLSEFLSSRFRSTKLMSRCFLLIRCLRKA
jgi:nuclear pore complex protein Nup93